MKLTLTFIAFFVLITSMAAQAQAPKVQGQQSATGVYSPNILVPNNSATKINGTTSLIETGNDNLLANPSFEAPIVGNAIPGWTIPDALLTAETTAPFHGKQSLKITYNDDPIRVIQSSTLNAAAFGDGVDGVRTMAVKTSIAFTDTFAIYLCAIKAGVVQIQSNGTEITNCVKIQNDGKWREYVYPSILGATSNGLELVSVNPKTGSLAGAIGEVFIDKAVVKAGSQKQIAPVVTQSSFVNNGGASVSGTNITGVITSSSGGGLYSYNSATGIYTVLKNSNLCISGNATAAGTTSVQVQIITGSGPILAIGTNDAAVIDTSANANWCGSLPSGETFFGKIMGSTGNNTKLSVLASDSSSTSYLADKASSFSTNTNPLYFKATAITDSDPVGTFNTYSYAVNTNTKTICGTAPTQSIADIKTNGIQIFTRAYNAASTCGNPARIEVKLGKGMQDIQKLIYKSTGKNITGSLDFTIVTAAINRGMYFKNYEDATGVLVLDTGFDITGTGTDRAISYTDGTSTNNGYFVINAQKAKETMVAELKASNISGMARYIVKTYRNMHDWWEIYNDGWVRQGSIYAKGAVDSNNATIPLLVTMQDVYHQRTISEYYPTAQTVYALQILDSSVSGLTIGRTGSGWRWAYWTVEGYGNSASVKANGATPSY